MPNLSKQIRGTSRRLAAKSRQNAIAKHHGDRQGNWRKHGLNEFVFVLADDRTEYALIMEILALKKSVILHIFEAIKKELDACLQTKSKFSSKKGKKANRYINCQAASKILKAIIRSAEKNTTTSQSLVVENLQ